MQEISSSRRLILPNFAHMNNFYNHMITKIMNSLFRFIFCFILFAASLINAETVIGKCVGVTDGDTATVLVDGNRQLKIRFDGIDAPERSQDFGQRAKQKLSDLIYGKQVKVVISDIDKYGRSVGTVYVGGINTNLELVKCGLAWHYVQYAPNNRELASAERAARNSKIGLWSHSNPTPPWEYRRGGSRESRAIAKQHAASGKYWVSGSGKIHNSSCRYYGVSDAGTYTNTPQGANCKACGGAGDAIKSASTSKSQQGKVKHPNTTGGKYWITGSSGKTHRKGCRWYGNTQDGCYSDEGSGDNCKRCGGAGR